MSTNTVIRTSACGYCPCLLSRSGDVPETDLSQLLDFGNILEEVRISGAPSSPGVELLHGPWPWPVFTLTKNPGVTAEMERVRLCRTTDVTISGFPGSEGDVCFVCLVMLAV